MPVFEHTRRDGRLWPWALGGALFVLLMLRACAFGAVYWPQLDDYIQYHNYPTSGSFSQLQQSPPALHEWAHTPWSWQNADNSRGWSGHP